MTAHCPPGNSRTNDTGSQDASAFWIDSPGAGSIRTERLLPPAGDEVLVRTIYSGISRGTESLVFQGGVPTSEYERMRAPFQAGEFPGPVKYGYINVGEVEVGPAGLLGTTVFSMFPHQTRFVVPAAAVTPLPQGVPAERAVLAATLETAINGLWDAAPRIGDKVSVIGAGGVGCLVAWLASRLPGCDVQLIDIDPARGALAQALRVSFATPGNARGEADLVIHASGSEAGLRTALSLAAFEATIVEMSWFGGRSVSIPLGGAFHSRRLTLRSSQVGAVATAQRARWPYKRRIELALSLLRDATLDRLITGEDDFAQLPAVMARLADAPGGTVCHRIRYP